MNTSLARKHFDSDAELHASVNQWLHSQVADFYGESIEKLLHGMISD